MSGQRILIVENEALIAVLLEDILAQEGYVCVGICTTRECALAKIEKTPIDAVILNLVLKGEVAYDVCAALAVKNIPFAFASGVMQDAIDPLWRERLYIRKPYSAEEVCSVLEKLLTEPDMAIARTIEGMPPPITRATNREGSK